MTHRLTALAAMTLLFVAATPLAQAQDRHHGGDRESIECKSHDMGRTRCRVDWRDARLVDQLSDTDCVRGRNWDLDRRGIWVNRGCSGRFVEAGRHDRDRADRGDHYDNGDRGGWTPGPGWDSRFNVVCESKDYQYRFCAVDLGGAGRVSVARQISNSACVEGRNFGFNRAGVWVTEGCAAEFQVDRRWR